MADEKLYDAPSVALEFGRLIRTLRRERGISQNQLAAAVDCHINHISYMERGLRGPSLVLTLRLADALGIPMPDLMTMLVSALQETRDGGRGG